MHQLQIVSPDLIASNLDWSKSGKMIRPMVVFRYG